jgi:hypothetical protein
MALDFLKPKRDAVERQIRDLNLRADQLAREGHRFQAEGVRAKARKLEDKVLPKAR